MLIKFKPLFQAIKASRTSEYLGDIAILKAEAFGARMNPKVAPKMQSVVGYHPVIDLEKLSHLPEQTFGYQYASHMKQNHLKPLQVSPELSTLAEKNVLSLRYVITHDIFHVLLGFDTSYAGEIGVLAFAVEQNYSQQFKLSLRIARFLYPILAPFQASKIFENIRKGRELGQQAKFLLNYRFEENWERPLSEIQTELELA